MERTRSYEHVFFDGAGLVPTPERLRKVLVVGAGVAGLQAARQMLKLGCQVLVLETNDEVGGVWIRNYIGYGLQVPWRMYQFPEFPWPKDLQPSSEYPTGQEVQEYVKAYCREYDLRRYIRFNCKLLRLRWCAASRQWDALYCDTFQEKFFKVTVDYTVICAGIYSQPYIPDYEGTDTYAGIQLHAKDFVDLSLARGRRVVIVGAGKTALDCVSSIVATNTATSVTLLYRQAHWPLPRRMLGTSVRRLLFNRAMTSMMPPYYTAGGAQLAVSKAAAPLRKLFWKSVESIISRKFRITEQMRPRVHLPTDLFYGGQILDNTMDKLVRSEAMLTIKGEINRFVRNGVILQDGNFVAADLVLYCTGYLKTYDYLEGEMRSRLDLQKDGLYLYRNCLPYAVPHLAFIGSEVSTYNNILTHGLQALWLAHVLSGRISLPSPGAMAEDVRAQQRWRRSVMPAQRSRGSVLMLYMMHYHDQLLKDMGQRTKRKGINILAECFGAYTAKDYHGLLTDDETILAARNAEAQLAAAGVPPGVLAATAADRAGVVPGAGGDGAGGGVGAATPPGTRSDQRGSAGSDISGVAPAAGSVAAVYGGGGGGGDGCTGVAAAAAVLRTAPGHPVLEDRLLSGSSRAGTSMSVRSGSGQGYHTEETALGAAGLGPGARTGSGQGYLQPPVGVPSAAATLLAVPAHGSTAGIRPSTQRYSAVGAASTGRIPLTDVDLEFVVHSQTAALRPPSAMAVGLSGAAAAGPASPAGAAPIWARTEQQCKSAHAISMRISTDLSTAARTVGGAAAAAGSYASAGGAVRRPATATAIMYASSPRVLPRHSRANSSESDVRSHARGVLRAAAAAAAAAPQEVAEAHALGQSNGGDVVQFTSSDGSSSGRSYGTTDAAGATSTSQGVSAERVSLAAVAAAAAANRRHSFSSRNQREGSPAVVGPASASAAAASPLGYPPPNSPSRLSRHTGPASPVPCRSAHHWTHGSLKGSGEAWPSVQTCHSGGQNSQHVRWNLLNSTIDEGPVVPRSGSGGGDDGSVRPHLKSPSSVRSAPENTVSVVPSTPAGNLSRSGGSSGDGVGDGSAAGAADTAGQLYDAPSPLRPETESAPTLVLPSRFGDGTAHHPPATSLECPAARASSELLPVELGFRRGDEAAVSCRNDCDLGCGITATSAAASAGAAAGALRPDEGSDTDARHSSVMGGGGGGGEVRRKGGAVCPNSLESLDGSVRASLAVAVATTRSIASGGGSAACTARIGAVGAMASSSDRSHRLSSCSPSHSSADTERVPDGGGCSGSGSSSSSGCANAMEASVMVIAGGGSSGGGKDTGRSDGRRVRSGAAAAASSKVHPVLDDGDGDSGSGIMALSSGPPLQPSTPQPQPVGTPLWLAAAGVPETRGYLNGNSDGVYGSPSSGTISLSLWHAAAAVTGGLGRPPVGFGVRAPTGSCGGTAESRLSALSRGRLIEESDSVDGGERDGQSSAADVLGEVGAAVAAFVAGEVKLGRAAASNGGTEPGVANGGGGSRGGVPAAATTPVLTRANSSIGNKSPPRRGAFGRVSAGARDWLRSGSLARSNDGMTSPAAAPALNSNPGGGGRGVDVAAAGAAGVTVGWPLFVHTSSMGTYSTGSSNGQIHTSISLAGGVGAGGSAGGSSAAALSPAGTLGSLPGPMESVARQLSRVSGSPATDSTYGAPPPYTGSGGTDGAGLAPAAEPPPPRAETSDEHDRRATMPAGVLSPGQQPSHFPAELTSPFALPKNFP